MAKITITEKKRLISFLMVSLLFLYSLYLFLAPKETSFF